MRTTSASGLAVARVRAVVCVPPTMRPRPRTSLPSIGGGSPAKSTTARSLRSELVSSAESRSSSAITSGWSATSQAPPTRWPGSSASSRGRRCCAVAPMTAIPSNASSSPTPNSWRSSLRSQTPNHNHDSSTAIWLRLLMAASSPCSSSPRLISPIPLPCSRPTPSSHCVSSSRAAANRARSCEQHCATG